MTPIFGLTSRPFHQTSFQTLHLAEVVYRIADSELFSENLITIKLFLVNTEGNEIV